MPRFVMLTRVEPEALRSPASLEQLEQKVMENIRRSCPEVKWISSHAVLGPYDYIDIFEAPDNEIAARVSTLIRVHGRSHSETWPATEWEKFKGMLHSMSG